MNSLLLALALSPAADPADWKTAEGAHLRNIKQLTSEFIRAGEGYFSPDGKQIIFQAEEKGTGNPFYQIFVQDLDTGKFRRISPGLGRTTCAFFRPDGKKVIFASSHEDPEAKKIQAAEYVRREEDAKKGIHRRYSWDFDPYMKIYEANPDGTELKCLTPWAKAYTAEGNYSADGKQIVFASGNADNTHLYTMNADGTGVKQVTKDHVPAPTSTGEKRVGSYNGGPFFSPDAKRIIFRTDRKEKERLQLYVINSDGTGETALTDNDNWVYWAPYWYKDGQHIIYTAADHSVMGRPNYDLYWMHVPETPKDGSNKGSSNLRREPLAENTSISPLSASSGAILCSFCSTTADGAAQPKHKPVRLTYAPGADVLPVFSPDYKKVMWTSSRDGASQLYIADFVVPKDDE